MRKITLKIPDFTFRTFVILSFLLAGIGLTWYYSPQSVAPEHVHEESEAGGPEDKIILTKEALRNVRIETIEVERRQIKEWLEAPGVVEPNSSHVVRIRVLARGIVRLVHVHLGERVRTGQVLFEYDNVEVGELLGKYRKCLSRKVKLEARSDVARQTAERAQRLAAAEALAQKELELRIAEKREAQAELEAHLAEIDLIFSKLARFGVTRETVSELSWDYSILQKVKAPQPGVVLDFRLASGEVIFPDQQVMTIADLSHIWIKASVYEKDLGRVKVGQTAEISFVAFPKKTFLGKIVHVHSHLDPQTRTVSVHVETNNPGENLKLEMFGTVRFPTEDHIALVVPETAIQRVDGKDVVFIQTGVLEFQKRNVDLVHKADTWIEIASGVTPGERVVIQGGFYLKSILLRDTLGEHH